MEILNNPGFYVTYALLQALVLIVLVRLVDPYEREPLPAIALVAAWGATGAAFLALLGNSAVASLLSPRTQEVFGAAISAPVVEELAKGVALVVLVAASWWASPRFGTPAFSGVTDGLLYGVAVGLGFAFTEDFFYFLNRASAEGIESGFRLFLARRDFFGPQSLHHPLFTAPFGVAVGLATWSRTRRWRICLPMLGLLAAVLIHAVNNGLVELILTIRYGLDATAAYISGGVVSEDVSATGLQVLQALRLIDYTYLALAFVGILIWQRYQRRLIFSNLRGEVAAGLVTASDRETVVRASKRLRTYLYLLRKRDFDGFRRLRTYHQAVAKLGLLKWRVTRFGMDPKLVRDARRRLGALRAITAPPGNVPMSKKSVVGRRRDLARVASLLQRDNVRLLTLTGAAGVGRTTLAVEVATRFADLRPGGAYYVTVTTPAEVPTAIARVLDIKEMRGQPLVSRIAERLDKRLLLVIDRTRYDDEGMVDVIRDLMDAVPLVQVVVTSDVRLELPGEREHLLQPLSLARIEGRRGAKSHPPDAASLFALRALEVKRTFVLDEQNARDVADICREVGGLPICIELAAAWIRFLAVDQILRGIREHLDAITAGSPGSATARDRVRATFNWSYSLLDTEQKRVLQALTLFSAGCDADAIEGVTPSGAEAEWDEIETVISLVERCFVQQYQPVEGTSRFEMTPTIRNLVLEQRRIEPAVEDWDALEREFANYYLTLAETAEADFDDEQGTGWKLGLDREYSNLTSALDWSEQRSERELTVRLAAALRHYWEQGLLGPGRRWLEPTLRDGRELAPAVRAKGAEAAGALALLQADLEDARRFFSWALESSLEVNDETIRMKALWGSGWAAMLRGDGAGAVPLFEESVLLARRLDDEASLATALTGSGRALAEEGRVVEARELLERGLKLRRFVGDDYGEADSLANLGRLSLIEGRADLAVLHLRESIELSERLGDKVGSVDMPRMRILLPVDLSGDPVPVGHQLGQRLRAGEALHTLALARLEQSEARMAVPLLADRLAICGWLGDRLGLVETLEGLAAAASTADPLTAARLFGFVATARATLRAPGWAADRPRYERALNETRAALGNRFVPEWEAGVSMSIGDARDLADDRSFELLGLVSVPSRGERSPERRSA